MDFPSKTEIIPMKNRYDCKKTPKWQRESDRQTNVQRHEKFTIRIKSPELTNFGEVGIFERRPREL